jgi:hypothetical protein
MFCNIILFYSEDLSAPRPTPKLEDHTLSAVCDCLFNAFTATLHNWRPFLRPQPENAQCRGDRDSLNKAEMCRHVQKIKWLLRIGEHRQVHLRPPNTTAPNTRNNITAHKVRSVLPLTVNQHESSKWHYDSSGLNGRSYPHTASGVLKLIHL